MAESFNTSDIVANLADATGMSKSACQEMTNGVFSIIREALSQGHDVRVSNFGTFYVSIPKNKRRKIGEFMRTVKNTVKLRASSALRSDVESVK